MKNKMLLAFIATFGSLLLTAQPPKATPAPARISFCLHWEAVNLFGAYEKIRDEFLKELDTSNPVQISNTNVPVCRIAFGKLFVENIQSESELKELAEEAFYSTDISRNRGKAMSSFVQVEGKSSPILRKSTDSNGVEYYCQQITEAGTTAFFEKLVPVMPDFFDAIAYKHSQAYGTPTGITLTPTDKVSATSTTKLGDDNYMMFSCDNNESYRALLNLVGSIRTR